MPLDRAHMTPAEKITLRMYPLVYAVLGVVFIVQAPSRTSSPAFDAAKVIMPIRVWGLVFLGVAILELVALLLTHTRRHYIWALVVGAGLATFWLVLAIASATQSTLASFSGACWVAVAVGAQVASAKMLASRGDTA